MNVLFHSGVALGLDNLLNLIIFKGFSVFFSLLSPFIEANDHEGISN